MAELLGAFEQAVLMAIVKCGDDAYGREVFRAVNAVLGREVVAGAVYATLDRLEDKAAIASRLEAGTAARGGRAKRYYRLTALGITALNESRSALERIWAAAKWPLELPV